MSQAEKYSWTEFPEPGGRAWEDDFVACGVATRVFDGGVTDDPELYSFAALDEELAANPDLAALAGMTSVSTCAEARLLRALQRERPAQPTETELATLRGAPTPSPEEEPARVDKIADGYAATTNHQATVWLYIWHGTNFSRLTKCSGTIIGDREILTAAHCIPGSKDRPISVKAYDGTCLHGNCSSETKPGTTAYAWRHGSYSGTGDWGDDVAVIKTYNQHGAPLNDPGLWMRIATHFFATGDSVWLSGWGDTKHDGSGSGTLRSSNQDVEIDYSYDSLLGSFYYFGSTTVTGEGRPCTGDSGGPAISVEHGAYRLIAGVTSGGEGGSEHCPYPGDRFFHTQIAFKAGWIRDRIGGCTEFSSSGWEYIRCW